MIAIAIPIIKCDDDDDDGDADSNHCKDIEKKKERSRPPLESRGKLMKKEGGQMYVHQSFWTNTKEKNWQGMGRMDNGKAEEPFKVARSEITQIYFYSIVSTNSMGISTISTYIHELVISVKTCNSSFDIDIN